MRANDDTQPGNPNRGGRPKNPVTQLCREARDKLDQMAAVEALRVFANLLKASDEGDVAASKALLERVWPSRRGNVVSFPVLPTRSAADIGAAIDGLIQAVGAGELTPDEARQVCGMYEARLKAYETAEVAAELEELKRVARERREPGPGLGTVAGRA